jgi:hypothetical protein
VDFGGVFVTCGNAVGPQPSLQVLDDLAKGVRLRSYAADNLIIKQGDQGESCYLIVSGSVDVCVEPTNPPPPPSTHPQPTPTLPPSPPSPSLPLSSLCPHDVCGVLPL